MQLAVGKGLTIYCEPFLFLNRVDQSQYRYSLIVNCLLLLPTIPFFKSLQKVITTNIT